MGPDRNRHIRNVLIIIALALAEKVGAKGAEAFFAERGRGADPERAARWLEGRP